MYVSSLNKGQVLDKPVHPYTLSRGARFSGSQRLTPSSYLGGRDTQLPFQLQAVLLHARGEVFVALVHGAAPAQDAASVEVALGHKVVCQLEQQLDVLSGFLETRHTFLGLAKL